MLEGKFVKIVAPGGAVLNFVGVAGTTEKVLVEEALVNKLLDRGCEVFEIKEEEAEGETKVTYTPLYNPHNERGEEKYSEEEKKELEKKGYKPSDSDNGGKKTIDEKLEHILIKDLEQLAAEAILEEETKREEAVGKKIAAHIKELDAQETVETKPKTEEELITEKASAHFKKFFTDKEEEEKAKAAEAAKTEEDRKKETALDKGLIYRPVPHTNGDATYSSFKVAISGTVHPAPAEEGSTPAAATPTQPAAGAATGTQRAGSDSHTTTPSTTERTETSEATHAAAPGSPETTGSTTSSGRSPQPAERQGDHL